jgi:hypothetical protein
MPATGIIGYQNATDIVLDMATTVAAGATETFSIVVTRAFRVVGVTCIAEATAAASTVEVRKGASVISTGIAMVTANAVTNASSVASAVAAFAVGDTLNIAVTSGAGVNAQGIIIVRTEPLVLGDATAVTAV